MASKAYGFADVVASISGPGGSFGLANGAAPADEGIVFEWEEDKVTMTIGADGTPMFSLHAGNGASATLTLQKTSPVNAQLMGMYNLQRVSSGLVGTNIITLSQKSSNDKVTALAVAFRKAPNLNFGKEAGNSVWTFFVGDLSAILGTY